MVLVAVGATKAVSRRAVPALREPGRLSRLDRALTLHEKRPRLLGVIEAAVGALALMYSSSLWPAVLVSGLGLLFSSVLMLRLRVIPTRGCGCIRNATAGTQLQLSSVCRALTICIGGLCGLAPRTNGSAFARGSMGAALAWIVVIAAQSPELWQRLKFRCGRPLVFSVRDDLRRLMWSSEYQRLRVAGTIAKYPSDDWPEGCVRYFVFPVQEHGDRRVATFQVGPSGVYGRVLSRPASPGLGTEDSVNSDNSHPSDVTERASPWQGALPS